MEIVEHTGFSRSSVRRIVSTLAELGYLRKEGQRFFPTARVLSLGHTDSVEIALPELARPTMKNVAADLGQTVGLSTLDRADVVRIGEVETIMPSMARIEIGARLPAYATSMGRVLLGGLPASRFDELITHTELRHFTEHTLTDPGELRRIIGQTNRIGYSVVDEELEVGVRSVAVPIRDGSGVPVAALDLTFPASVAAMSRVKNEFVPRLLAAARTIGRYMPAGYPPVKRSSAQAPTSTPASSHVGR